MNLKIDQEFKNLIPPLTHEERELLEKNIVKEGCRDAIVVWDNTIIDGHNRYEICTAHDLEYKVAYIELLDRNAVINWIIDNQLGKRNVPEQVKKYLIGKRYTGEKAVVRNQGGVNQYSEEVKGQTDPKPNDSHVTASKIADQNKISEKTVRRDEDFSESLDLISKNSGKSAMDILTNTKVTHEDVKKISTLTPEVQKEIVNKVTTGETKTFKEALKPIIEAEKKEIIQKSPDNDYCHINNFIPTLKQVTVCPCGCGYGYCEINEKWYTQVDMAQLDEE